MHNEAKAENLLPLLSRQLKQTAIVVYQFLIRIIISIQYFLCFGALVAIFDFVLKYQNLCWNHYENIQSFVPAV